jgi:hypothetical protein
MVQKLKSGHTPVELQVTNNVNDFIPKTIFDLVKKGLAYFCRQTGRYDKN